MDTERIEILFDNDSDMERFVSFYRGTPGFFGHAHSNYTGGTVDIDRILGSWRPVVYLERKHVKDFRILGQDIKMYNGKIRV